LQPSELTTLEGLGTLAKPHPLQKAFIDEQARNAATAPTA
jgi:aerobic-type carbon monoxide dehydrogenase small subunit (CoxS/CutS family)